MVGTDGYNVIGITFGDSRVFRCDLATLKLDRYKGHGFPQDVVINPTGTHAVILYEDHGPELLSMQTGDFTPIEGPSQVAAIDGSLRLYYATQRHDVDQEICAQTIEGRVLTKIPCRNYEISCLRVSLNDARLAIGYINGVVDVADISEFN